jgi:hypothetical protein
LPWRDCQCGSVSSYLQLTLARAPLVEIRFKLLEPLGTVGECKGHGHWTWGDLITLDPIIIGYRQVNLNRQVVK